MIYKQVKDHIQGLSPEQLADYIRAGPGMYQPEAIEFARLELRNRGVHPDQVAQIEAEAQARAAAKVAGEIEVAHRPLAKPWKVLAFIGGFIGFPLLLFLIVSGRLRSRGEH